MKIKQFVFNYLSENSYIVWSDGPECILVDPSYYTEQERAEFNGFLSANSLTPAAILITHGHFDHLFGVKELQDKFRIPVYMGAEDTPNLSHTKRIAEKLGLHGPDIDFTGTPVPEGLKVAAAGLTFEAILTPGHSPGGVCWLEREEKTMFTGDTLFAGTIGRTDLQGGDYDALIVSIMEKLIFLPGGISILPGHGPSSDIATERTTNPFLEPFNEKEELENLPEEGSRD